MIIFLSVWTGFGVLHWCYMIFKSVDPIVIMDFTVALPVAILLGPIPMVMDLMEFLNRKIDQ